MNTIVTTLASGENISADVDSDVRIEVQLDHPRQMTVNVTSEGIIVDLYDVDDDEHLGTFAATFDELADSAQSKPVPNHWPADTHGFAALAEFYGDIDGIWTASNHEFAGRVLSALARADLTVIPEGRVTMDEERFCKLVDRAAKACNGRKLTDPMVIAVNERIWAVKHEPTSGHDEQYPDEDHAGWQFDILPDDQVTWVTFSSQGGIADGWVFGNHTDACLFLAIVAPAKSDEQG